MRKTILLTLLTLLVFAILSLWSPSDKIRTASGEANASPAWLGRVYPGPTPETDVPPTPTLNYPVNLPVIMKEPPLASPTPKVYPPPGN